MNGNAYFWLMLIGLLMSSAGAMGLHVFSKFNGGELERYCRLRRNRDRYGEILDQHEQVINSAFYLHLLGLFVLLPGAAWWLTSWQNRPTEQTISDNWRYTSSQVLLALGSLLTILCLSSWLPRAVARAAPASFIYYTWPLWKIIGSLVSPLSAVGSLFEAVGFRLRDEPPDENFEEELLEDEIRTKIAAGQREGLVGVGVSEMIAGVMNLDEEDVTRIMTPRSAVDAIDGDLPWNEILKTVADTGRTRLPVFRETPDNIIGILYAKDLLPILASGQTPPILSSLLRKPWFVPDTKQVDELLRDFLHNRNHIAIVLDSFHQFVGVVTIEDALEQIVGEIADELDEEVANQIRVVDNGETVDSEGAVSIDDLNKRFGWNLPDSDDFDTIGGLVISRLGVIPPEGTRLTIEGIQIEVTRASKRQIARLRLRYLGRGNLASA